MTSHTTRTVPEQLYAAPFDLTVLDYNVKVTTKAPVFSHAEQRFVQLFECRVPELCPSAASFYLRPDISLNELKAVIERNMLGEMFSDTAAWARPRVVIARDDILEAIGNYPDFGQAVIQAAASGAKL